jgi:hypothetical protein
MTLLRTTALCVCLALPLAAQARPSSSDDWTGIHQDLADARNEMHADLAESRRELETGNLQLNDNFVFSRHGHHDKSRSAVRAEITPAGDLLIDGKAQEIDAGQRQQLLAYRKQVVAVALAGVETGQVAAEAALDAVDGSWIGLVFGAMTGSLERRVERVVKQQIQPTVLAICRQLPALRESQQQLASSLPKFRPYATLEPRDIDDCEDDVRDEFASN